jgi:phytoene synthase
MNESFFREQSSTLSLAAKQLPKDKQQEVATLYTFLKSIDYFVTKGKRKEFFQWSHDWQDSWNGELVDNAVIESFMDLSYKYQFERKWIESFFASKKFDLEKKVCEHIADTIWYMYGSAEVIGLMFCRICNLDEQCEKYAALMGRSLQYLSFIRNMRKHLQQQKMYIPVPKDMNGLSRPKTEKDRKAYTTHIQKQLTRYKSWMAEARKGFPFIPYKLRASVMTMADAYDWIAKQIERNPDVIFYKRIIIPTHIIKFYALRNKASAFLTKEN